jgi:hypothetical protein
MQPVPQGLVCTHGRILMPQHLRGIKHKPHIIRNTYNKLSISNTFKTFLAPLKINQTRGYLRFWVKKTANFLSFFTNFLYFFVIFCDFLPTFDPVFNDTRVFD